MLTPINAPPPYAGRCFAAFLFDMDGTLITSIDSANGAWTRWSQMRGFDPAYVISIMHGVRTVETMRKLGVADPEAEAAWITRTEIEDTEGVEPARGSDGFPGGIATESLGDRDLGFARVGRGAAGTGRHRCATRARHL